MTKAHVILFRPSGKYYTDEYWRIPTYQDAIENMGYGYTYAAGDLITPYGMVYSPDFRRIDGGPVLVPTQEPWGYPHLFPGLKEEQ